MDYKSYVTHLRNKRLNMKKEFDWQDFWKWHWGDVILVGLIIFAVLFLVVGIYHN